LDGTVRAWAMRSDVTTHVKTFRANGDGLTCLAALQGLFCAGSDSGLVWVWRSIEDKHPTAFLNASSAPINTLLAAPDGKVFVGAGSGRITV
jgi:WD40 repeat protein